MSLKMRHFLLRTHVRNNLSGRFWKVLIFSVNCVKYDHFGKFSGFCTGVSGRAGGRTGLSEVEVVAKRIHVGWSEEEILSSLVRDEGCEAISLNCSLVDTLLCRFKDDWKAALGVFRWAETRSCYEHLPETCDMMVDILGKARQFSKMRKLVSEMGDRNLVSLNTVAKMMRRFAGARQWRDVVATFDDLGTFGLEKNTESMNLLLDALCKENRVEMARTIFMELKSHIPPTLNTFNIFIHGWCKIKRVEEADWTLQEMKGYGFTPCVVSYSIIIKSYCLLLNWSKAYELLDVMKAHGCEPSVVTYTTIMSLLTKAGEHEHAFKVASMVKSSGCKFDTTFYNALIHTLGKAQRVEEAINVFKVEMPNNGVPPNTNTYNTLIAMCCHHGQEHMAFDILEVMDKSGVCKPDLRTFNPLLKAYFKSGMTGNCFRLLDAMTAKHHLSLDVSTYSLLIHGLCKVDNCERAFQLFEEMIDKGLTVMHHTCLLLLDEVKQKSMYDAAERVDSYMKALRESRQQNFPDSHRRSVSFGE